jgi:hypothetical protein
MQGIFNSGKLGLVAMLGLSVLANRAEAGNVYLKAKLTKTPLGGQIIEQIGTPNVPFEPNSGEVLKSLMPQSTPAVAGLGKTFGFSTGTPLFVVKKIVFNHDAAGALNFYASGLCKGEPVEGIQLSKIGAIDLTQIGGPFEVPCGDNEEGMENQFHITFTAGGNKAVMDSIINQMKGQSRVLVTFERFVQGALKTTSTAYITPEPSVGGQFSFGMSSNLRGFMVKIYDVDQGVAGDGLRLSIHGACNKVDYVEIAQIAGLDPTLEVNNQYRLMLSTLRTECIDGSFDLEAQTSSPVLMKALKAAFANKTRVSITFEGYGPVDTLESITSGTPQIVNGVLTKGNLKNVFHTYQVSEFVLE